MPDQDYTPIKTVTPCTITGTATGSAVTNLPIPASYTPTLVDVSAPDAGRTEDMAMHKMRMGQTIRYDVVWKALTRAQMATLLSAYQSEYVNAETIDPRVASGYTTKRFYVGDRKMDLWNSYKGIWENLSLALIQQDADVV